MAITEQQVQAALKELTDPNTGKDYVTGKEAKNIKIDGDDVSLDIVLGYPAKTQVEPIRKAVIAKLKGISGHRRCQRECHHKDRHACGPARRETHSQREEHHSGGIRQRGSR